mgnify:CR=1 FL=1
MEALKGLYAKLRLKVNESKSAVARPRDRKFLGYSFWAAKGEVKLRVAPKALKKMKERVKWITRRSGGRSMKAVTAELREYLTGWKEYFRAADTPAIFSGIDGWIRRRLLALQLIHWRHGTTVYRHLRARGVPRRAAQLNAEMRGDAICALMVPDGPGGNNQAAGGWRGKK